MRRCIAPFVAVFLLAASAKGPEASAAAMGQMPLQPVAADSAFGPDANTLISRSNAVDFSRNTALPTKVNDGADGGWGSMSPQDRDERAQQVTADFPRAVGAVTKLRGRSAATS